MTTRKINKKDNGATIHLQAGDRLEIELPENATTGYKWLLPGMNDIRVKERFQPQEAGIPGSSGTAFFELEPQHSIPARKIIMKYQRPWETDLPPEDSFFFTLTVQ
jgi:inhibitor of cysteine peptidase